MRKLLPSRPDDNRQTLFHLDFLLLLGLLSAAVLGLVILYSAGDKNLALVQRQAIRLCVGFAALFVFAQIPARVWYRWAPWIFAGGLAMLVAVLLVGTTAGGAQRWLNLGVFRFQPSELMKLAVPMMVAWYLADRPLPPSWQHMGIAAVLIVIPFALIIKQPDLGTALLIASAGGITLFLAGMSRNLIIGLVLGVTTLAVLIVKTSLCQYLLRPYQCERIETFFNPEKEPLGAGYHIIQSKIAIGSGGLYGKGLFMGTQSHLEFLPERTTDFIFAVFSEEHGFIGVVALLVLYLFIIIRGLYLAAEAQGTFARLVAGSIVITFFVYIFVNIGMVSGILPVVGLPLPLVSYGGTSVVSLLAGFGIVMSAYSHRRLLSDEKNP